MQISNVHAGQQIQKLSQATRNEGSQAEEANESASAKAAEAQKSAIAQRSGLGINVDIRA